MEHYDATKYPLAVKLGTITPDGGDVHSYDEDDMVEDPKLAQHLEHFGINMMSMTKVIDRAIFALITAHRSLPLDRCHDDRAGDRHEHAHR